MKQETKKWYNSRTIWINIFVILSGFFGALVVDLQAGGTITGIGILNIILRLITKTKLD